MVLHCAYNRLQGFSDNISISRLRLSDLPSNYEHELDIPRTSLYTVVIGTC